MPNLFDLIPGYREAVEREDADRREAFVQAPEMVCGIDAAPLTLERVALLESVGSPFMVGGVPEPGDVALFLWVISPGYRPGDARARDRFIRRCRRLPYAQACVEIESYVSAAFADAPAGRAGEHRPVAYWAAAVVDALASEYGWVDDAILRLPLRRLWQYWRCARRRHDPKAIFIDRSDKVRGEWLRQRNDARTSESQTGA